MTRIGNALRHLRNGTLLQRLRQGRASLPVHARVRWQGAESEAHAITAISDWGRFLLQGKPENAWVLCLGDGNSVQIEVSRMLTSTGTSHQNIDLGEILNWDEPRIRGLAGILNCHCDARQATNAARAIARHPVLADVPFESTVLLQRERSAFAQWDEYADSVFISPGMLDNPTPYDIYEESLQHCEQKCGLRDYLDLYQLLHQTVCNDVPGDVAEFGSYRGHSGWLIARTLQVLDSDKRLFMFDTFDSFPEERTGVDHFWNESHHVDFASVQSLMATFSNVTLVQGDFTETLMSSELKQVALAYIDCDSYRATRFLIDTLWGNHLGAGSILVCEDYGHPALLGNRAAVHESMDSLPDCFRFFSQSSGLYITLKF